MDVGREELVPAARMQKSQDSRQQPSCKHTHFGPICLPFCAQRQRLQPLQSHDPSHARKARARSIYTALFNCKPWRTQQWQTLPAMLHLRQQQQRGCRFRWRIRNLQPSSALCDARSAACVDTQQRCATDCFTCVIRAGNLHMSVSACHHLRPVTWQREMWGRWHWRHLPQAQHLQGTQLAKHQVMPPSAPVHSCMRA